jgi:hypothetical protein
MTYASKNLAAASESAKFGYGRRPRPGDPARLPADFFLKDSFK